MKITTALFFIASLLPSVAPAESLTGKKALSGWRSDAPGLRRKITLADLPAPNATESANSGPKVKDRPADAWPKAPKGFTVKEFATDLKAPRKIITAPNGDIFVAESKSDRVSVLRDTDGDGVANTREVFADSLSKPFGLAFFPPTGTPQYLYVANTGSVVRFAYANGEMKASGKPETIVDDISAGGQLQGGGHWTRDIVFSKDGRRMFVSVGSKSNNTDDAEEAERARILEYSPDGKNRRVHSWGIRNPVGLAIDPTTGALWTSVNERDGLGDDLVPDYVTKVRDSGFYGWPWFYMGGTQDPKHAGKHPELKEKVITPDVLFVPHSASLCLTYSDGRAFPEKWQNGFFAAHHGSWNRSDRIGSKVVFLPTENGGATGEYVDFLTGFVLNNTDVWGRLVGVTFDKTGALLVSDDGGDCIWRVSHEEKE